MLSEQTMLRPAMAQILKEEESHYAFVVAVAKRAREIAEEAEENCEPLEVKPVNIAVDEFAQGKVRVDDIAKLKDM